MRLPRIKLAGVLLPWVMLLAGAAGWGLAASRSAPRNVPREGIEWCSVWIPSADSTKLPRVLLIGDSITQGYYSGVARRLEGRAFVARLTTSRSVCDPLFTAELRPVIEGYTWSVIHFNNGIHGQTYSEDAYRAGWRAALRYLEEKAGGARIIGVLSTPPCPGKDDGGAGCVLRRNAIVRDICREAKLPVNDLHAPMAGHAGYYRDLYHFKREAIELQAAKVAGMIERLLHP